MKKFFILIAVLLIGMMTYLTSSCTQCSSSNSNIAIEWCLSADASGSGIVEVTFPTGTATAKGDAEITVKTTSDTTAQVPNALSLDQAFDSTDLATREFALKVYESTFDVTTLEGEWEVNITGYAKEPTTGLYIIIDKHWPEKQVLALSPGEIQKDSIQ